MTTYGLGGSEVKQEGNESIHEIPQNRTLLVEKLTDASPIKPEMVEGLKTTDQVFEHFKPSVKVEFEDSDGARNKEALNFSKLSDFGVEGITRQSKFLLDLATEEDQYQNVIKQLKSNKVLRAALSDGDAKRALIDVIKSLRDELKV